MLVSRIVPDADIDLVHADNAGGMIQAVEHLIELGHRRIGLIGMNDRISTGQHRINGYVEALARHDIAFDPTLLMTGIPSRETGAHQVQTLLDEPGPPTATACFNDVVAFGAMLGLRARGLEPGVDFSVVGSDDIADSVLWWPALTSVSISRPRIGQAAVDP